MLFKLLNYLKPAPFIAMAMILLSDRAFAQIPPTAVWDFVYTDDDVPATGSLAENDLNPSGSPLTYTLLSNTNLGTLILQPNGDWTFVPVLGIAGVNQTIFYQVCDHLNQCSSDSIVVIVHFQNNPPVPSPDYITVEINEPRFGDVTINDIEPDSISDPVSGIDAWLNSSEPSHGDLIFNLDGTFQYTPDPGYTGPDQFYYNMCDPCGSCTPSIVYITVMGNNEEPVGSNSPLYSLNEDTSYSGDAEPLVTDPENDPLLFTTAILPSHGSVVMNSNGTYTYTPNPNYYGNDNFMYVACDIVGQCTVGFIYLSIVNTNDPPITANETFTTNEDIPSYSNTVGGNDSDEDGAISYTLLLGPAHGTFNLQVNGSFTYVPNANFNGQEIIYIQACDIYSLCSNDTLKIIVTPLNDFPIAVDDSKFGYEDTLTPGTVANNDSDADGDVLTFTVIDLPNHGSITMLANGTFTYTGGANYAGFDTIGYKVCDPSNACAFGTMIMEVIEINDDPIIVNDTATGNEDNVVTGNLRLNDTEPDGELINYFSTSGPDHGTLVLQWDGNFTYTPFANWNGNDTVEYWGCDPCSVCFLRTLIITILPVNDLPVANAVTFSTNEDVAYSASLSSAASDIEPGVLTFTVFSAASHGTFNLLPDGSYTYTPQLNYFGSDQVVYRVCDSQSGCSNATISITVASQNDTPVAIDDEASTTEDVAANGTVANDTDADDVVLTFSVITPPMHGSINMLSNGSFTYTPDANYVGVDMLTYSVCDDENACDAGVLVIDVTALNDAPLAVDDTNVTYENSTLNGNVAINDSDPDGDAMTFSLLTTTLNGSLNFLPNGSYTYIPNTNYSGTDIATYSVCDPSNACATAQLQITIVSTNSAPVASDLNLPATAEDAIINGNLMSQVNDLEGGFLSFAILTLPTHGTLTMTLSGVFSYTPDANYFGTDSFSYEVCDTGDLCDQAAVFITINSVNDVPALVGETISTNEDNSISSSVASNDSDNDNEVLTYSLVSAPSVGTFNLSTNGNFTFTPAANYFGTLSVVYSACDPHNACGQATLTIQVLPINDGPVAGDDTFTTNEDVVLNGVVTGNDSDVDNLTLSYSVVSNPTHGVLQLNADGTFIYTPTANYFGADSFQYSACDNGPLCDNATVTININSINDQPVAVDDVITIAEDSSANGSVFENDSDADGDALTFAAEFGALHGMFNMLANGTFTYTPDADYFGSEMIHYTACDVSNACAEGTLYILITPINDMPQVVGEEFTTNEDYAVSGDASLNDMDAESTILDYSIITGPLHGALVLDNEGQFTYTPTANYFGTENITYEVCDDDNGCVQATLVIIVNPVNDPPIVVGEYKHVLEDTSISGDLSLNDTDADGDELTYTIVTDATQGSFILIPDGNFQYTPTPDYSGVDSVIYQVCDPQNVCFEATIEIEVDFMNDPPVVYDETIEVLMNTMVSGSLLDNEFEPDGEILHYFVLVDESNGAFDLLDDGSYTYLPNDGVIGTFFVTYYACDPCAVCDTGMITIHVVQPGEENTTPVALNTSTTLCQGASVNVSLNELINDIQTNDSQLSIEITDPGVGSYTFDQSTHILNYSANISGDSFVTIEYTVCDNGIVPLCASGVINVSVLSVTSPMVGSSALTHVDCYGSSTGAINLSNITGGNNYTFQWDNGPDTEDLLNVPAGDYQVTIYSDKACSLPLDLTYTINQPEAALEAVVTSSIDISEGNAGAISLDITGGTAPYDVFWIGPNDFTSLNEDLIELTGDGNYQATITDAHGCIGHAAALITGVSNEIDFAFSVTPNPFRESLNLRFNGSAGKVSYRIYDAGGKLVSEDSSVSFKHGSALIDMKSQPAGCYQLQVIADTFTKTIGIVKE